MIKFKFTEGERHIFRRREAISVSAWAGRHIIVQDGPYSGARLRLDVAPYLSGIMDAWGRAGVEEICVCGAPQTGKTLALYACLGFAVDRRPGTKMLAMPDDNTLARVEAEKLKPLLTASPLIKGLLGKMTSGHIRLKDGSSLFLSSAQSPSQRASITVQDLFLDEEDLYLNIKGRGDPVTDFKERTRSYSFNRKIMRVSKPVGDSRSSIWRAVTQDVDMTLAYELVCPSCFGPQFLTPDNLRAQKIMRDGEESEPSAAEIERLRLGRYLCAHCDALWTDAQRDMAVSAGRWRPALLSEGGSLPKFLASADVENARRLGFYLPGPLSWAVSLSEVLAGQMKAAHTEDPELKQSFQNGIWALPYVPVAVEPDSASILARRDFSLPARSAPHGTVALTCGIDMQKRGFYYLVEAWLPNKARAIIDYGRLADFDDITRLVYETAYPVLGPDDEPGGQLMPIWRAALDTGGTKTDYVYTRTEQAYEYLRRFGLGVIHGAKGASRDQAVAVRWVTLDRMPRTGSRIPGGLSLYLVDTGKIKSGIFAALLDPEAIRPISIYGHDPGLDPADQENIHDELAGHLSAERQIRTASGKLVWEQVRADNHYLDCLMLAEACADVSWTPSLDHMLMQLEAETRAAAEGAAQSAPREKRPARKRSRW